MIDKPSLDTTTAKQQINNLLFMTLHDNTTLKEMETIACKILSMLDTNWTAHS